MAHTFYVNRVIQPIGEKHDFDESMTPLFDEDS